MIEKIIRSPLSMMFFVLLFGVLIYTRFYTPDFLTPYTSLVTFIVLIILAVYFSLITYHNRKNPNRKINFFGLIPYEMKEDDEGRQWVTFQACRKVYIFYSFAIPFSIILISLVNSPGLPILILLLLALVQYGIFWWEERKYNQDEQEEEF